jgi:hypothetical protein
MAICYIIECVVIDNKVALDLVISTFGVEEWRSKIVRILGGVFLVFCLQNFVVISATSPLSFLPNSPKATIIERFLT